MAAITSAPREDGLPAPTEQKKSPKLKIWFSLIAVLVLAGGVATWWLWPRGLFAGRAEWPEFRGPAEDGHSTATGLPTEWSTEKNVIWKTPLPGRAWSSPVVANDRIYLTNAIGTKDENDLHDAVSLRVLALNAVDGKLLWDREVFLIDQPFRDGIKEKNSHASPTPVFDHGRIYAHYGEFGSACVDEQGNIIWKTTEPTYKTDLGNGGSPILVDDMMIFTCEGLDNAIIVALDKATGHVRWKTPRHREVKRPYSLATPLLIEVKGERQIISPGTGMVEALAPKDGHAIWYLSHKGYCVVPRPVYGQGLVFFSTGFERPSLYAVNPDGKGNITDKNIVWTTEKNAPLTPSMLVVGEDFYMVSDNGIVTCMDAKTGNVYWSERAGKSTSASLLYADGKIYMQDEFGKGYVMKPGHEFKLLATNDLAEKSMASYAVHGSHLLIRTHHALWCIGEKK